MGAPYRFSARAAFAALATIGALTGAGCNCEGETFVAGTSALSADPLSIDLGRVFIGTQDTATIEFEVVGTVPVIFGGAFEGGNPSGFRASPAGGRIAASGRATMQVEFTPQVAGERTTTIRIQHDATETEGDLRIELRALGVAPPDCEDGNGCTIDRFDLETEQCVHEFQAVPCDDFNACTTGDTCVQGLCLGESVRCEDDNICTDDVCDPQQGCLHIPTRSCDDGNGCTRDFCDSRGCQHEDLDDGTPCEDFEQCTVGDICVFGQCRGVNAEDGFACDDLDPCSLNDQCIDGTCTDPGYRRANPGELKFATRVGSLAPGSSNNPIVDRDSTVFAGTQLGLVGVDLCGNVLWRNDALGRPNFGAAVSLPGILSVPFGATIVDVDASTGDEFRRLDLATDGHAPMVQTASTATVTITIDDMALRASGGIVVALSRTVSEPPSSDGWLAEVDPTHSIATLFRPLGQRRAARIAVDADEAVIALLVPSEATDIVQPQQLVRFGLVGLPDTTWSSNTAQGVHTDLAIGQGGEVLWSAGLLTLSRTGSSAAYLAPPSDPLALEAGAPVVDHDRIYSILRRPTPVPDGLGALPGGDFHLIAQTATTGVEIFDVQLAARAVQLTPAVDFEGNVFCMLEDGRVVGYAPDGQLMMQLQLPLDTLVDEPLALTLTPERVLIVITQQTVFGVQSLNTLSSSAWPRHRRDNLSTGHR